MSNNTTLKVTPSGWKNNKLSEFLLQKPDYGINAASVEFSNFLPAYLRITDISEDGKFLSIKKTSVNNSNSQKYILGLGDIVVARTGASVGKTYLYNKNDGQLVFAGFLIRIKPDNTKLKSSFLIAYTHTKKYFQWIKETSTRSGQPGINSVEYLNMRLLLPPLPEQNRIVTVLETWDKMIEKLSEKIIVKKQIKKSLMQDLLCGKKRVSEFKDKWEIVKLKTVCNIQKGQQLNKDNMIGDGVYRALNGGIEASGFTNTWNTKENTVTISEGGNSCGYINFNKEKFWCGGHCYAISPNKGIDNLFLYQILKTKQSKIMALRVGSGLPNIQKRSLDDFKISIPKSLEEQIAISAILSISDREISELGQKLTLLKDQKEYLLNNLITGKIRTPENMSVK